MLWPDDPTTGPVPSTAANVAIDLVLLILVAWGADAFLAALRSYAP